MNESKNINGGLEKVIVETHQILLENGYDSHVIDSMYSTYEAPNVHKISDPSKGKSNNELLASELEKYDVIIVHTHPSIVPYLNRKSIKYVYIDHWSLQSVNKVFYEFLFTTEWEKGKANGSIFLSVSEGAVAHKEHAVSKWAPNFRFDGYMKYQFVPKEMESLEIGKPDGKVIGIGRPTSEKKIHITPTLGLPYKIVSIMSENKSNLAKDHENYYQKKLKPIEDNIMWNLTREQTLEEIRNSSILYSTCPVESAGIVAFEALCLGVPVVLNEGKFVHASRMFATKDAWYICRSDEPEKIERFMNLSQEEKQSIADEVRSLNTKQQFLDSFISYCKMVENKKDTLESFFS